MNVTDTPRSVSLKAHVTPEEKEQIEQRARSVFMTNSDYMRKILIDFRIPQSRVEFQARRDLLAVAANLARLGNLLKLSINNAEHNQNLNRFDHEMRRLFAEIQDTKNLMREIVHRLIRTSGI